MEFKYKFNQNPEKIKPIKYSNASNHSLNIKRPIPLVATLAMVVAAIIFVISIDSSSPANTAQNPTPNSSDLNASKEPKAPAPKRDHLPLATQEKTIPSIPFCFPDQSKLNGNFSTLCKLDKATTARFEYFDSIEPLDLIVEQYNLQPYPKNPEILIRVGQFKDKNRLLAIDEQNLMALDIQSEYSPETLLNWLNKQASKQDDELEEYD